MRNLLDYIAIERTENHARIVLAPRKGSSIEHIRGIVRGPFSDFSKTLTADGTIKPGTVDRTFEALVVEPCYWTPRLPFWYELRVSLTFAGGSTREQTIPFGIKRFFCEGRNFLLEGKRTVLRGTCIESIDEKDLELARQHEVVLIVRHISDDLCAAADRLGVPLVVDLRQREQLSNLNLDWHASVMLALVDAEQANANGLRNVYTAILKDAGSDEVAVMCDAYAIELRPSERPPAWAATCNKPAIVIRKDPDADIRIARSGCDSLQAELAPEFDLAGYFV